MIDLATVPSPLLVPILEGNLRRLAKRHKVYDHVLEAVRLDLGADAAWLDRGRRGGGERLIAGDERLCAFARSGELLAEAEETGELRRVAGAAVAAEDGVAPAALPENLLLQRVEVNGRLHGVLGAARAEAPFAVGQGRRLGRLAQVLASDLERRHEERLTRVLDRIREKVISALRPHDLAYQILDGLHQLVRYDHSAALLTWHQEAGAFRVAAEKIVWAKAKSAFIGHEVRASEELLEALRGGSAVRRLTPGRGLDEADRPLHDLLDYYRGRAIPDVRDVLCAPLFFDDELIGMLKIADHRGRAFDDQDARVVERFLPAAAVSLRNMRVKQALEDQAVQAEIRAGLVTLARAVAHDVNNAIGAILPLAEQWREDLAAGRVDTAELTSDLDLIIDKAALCKRIFSNMLRVAGKRSSGGPVDLRQVVEEMKPILESQTAATAVRLEIDVPPGLPCVRFSKHHLERVLWNLVTNAIEALGGDGGRVRIEGRPADGGVELAVRDDGPGIPEEIQGKVVEPFFTTKPNGTGLGLSLVRSLVWQNEGDLEIESVPGRGTAVRVRLTGAECAKDLEG